MTKATALRLVPPEPYVGHFRLRYSDMAVTEERSTPMTVYDKTTLVNVEGLGFDIGRGGKVDTLLGRIVINGEWHIQMSAQLKPAKLVLNGEKVWIEPESVHWEPGT